MAFDDYSTVISSLLRGFYYCLRGITTIEDIHSNLLNSTNYCCFKTKAIIIIVIIIDSSLYSNKRFNYSQGTISTTNIVRGLSY